MSTELRLDDAAVASDTTSIRVWGNPDGLFLDLLQKGRRLGEAALTRDEAVILARALVRTAGIALDELLA